MIPKLTHYQTYILRIWYVRRKGRLVPVASLENCGVEENQVVERLAFPDLEALFEFIQSSAQLITVSPDHDEITGKKPS